MKTIHKFEWGKGYYTVRHLSRSFDALEDAVRFSEGKLNTDIYKSKGRYKVEWTKIIDRNED